MQPTAGDSEKKKQRGQPTIVAKRATEEQEIVQKQKACLGHSSQAWYLGSLFTLMLF